MGVTELAFGRVEFALLFRPLGFKRSVESGLGLGFRV